MEFNITPGRMTNPFAYLEQPNGSDDYGQPLPRTVVIETIWVDRDIKSGAQLAQMGEQITTELVTCLAYYDPRVKNSGWIRDLVNNIDYQIQHVRQSRRQQAMIITAKVESI